MASKSDQPGPATCPIFLDAAVLSSLLHPAALLRHFHTSLPSLSSAIQAPSRPHFPIHHPSSSSLIIMPAWSLHPSLPYIGVKIVTSFPGNSALCLPSVNASYILFRSSNGHPIAFLDGTHLTLLRTSTLAALAAKLLARKDAAVLSVVGAGALAPFIIKAHIAAVPTLKRVLLWNRTPDKARKVVEELNREGIQNVGFECRESLDEVVGVGDIVVCAVGSGVPLVKGELLKGGAHLGLIGSFSPSMRECDDNAIVRGRVFADCEEALSEAGELVGALERGVIKREDVGMFVDLMRGEIDGRRSDEEITVFKSVGFASLDILAAQLAYERHLEGTMPATNSDKRKIWTAL